MFPHRWFYSGLLFAVIFNVILLDSLPARTNVALTLGAVSEPRVTPDGVSMRRLNITPGLSQLEAQASEPRPGSLLIVSPLTTRSQAAPGSAIPPDQTRLNVLTPAAFEVQKIVTSRFAGSNGITRELCSDAIGFIRESSHTLDSFYKQKDSIPTSGLESTTPVMLATLTDAPQSGVNGAAIVLANQATPESKSSHEVKEQKLATGETTAGEDRHPPYIVNYLPPRYATTVPVTQKIAIWIRDDISGVDTNSIQLQINSHSVPPRFSGSIYLLQVEWDTVWNYNDSIQVGISAQDYADPPNRMSPDVYYFKTKTDRKPPLIYNRLPVAEAKNVPRNTAIRFTLMDEPAGVAVNTIRLFINQQAVTGWQSRGDSTQIEIIYQPQTPFDFAQQVQIGVEASDLVRPANVMSRVLWEFTTEIETDTTPPYTLSHQPGRFAMAVPLDAAIQVQIRDDAHGVDLNHLNMWVNAQPVRPEVTGNPRSYTLFYQPPAPFNYNDTVWVRIQATDLAEIPNSMPADIYYFTTVVDREPPFLTDLFPIADASGISSTTIVSFYLHDAVAGVDQNNIQLWLNGQLVVPEITGCPTDYAVRYQSITPFSNGQRVFGTVLAQDLSNPPNAMESLAFAFSVSENLPDLVLKEIRTMPANGIKKNQLVTIEAVIENQSVSITQPFQVSFWDNRQLIGDTVITAMPAAAQITVKRVTHFQQGSHYLTAMADSREDVGESNEVNNSQDLYLDVMEGQFSVRPNPFTPNGDGYNDEVQFSFSELNLNQPRLQLFNFENQRILTREITANSQFNWNGTDAAGNALPPGMYLYVLEDDNRVVASGCVILAR